MSLFRIVTLCLSALTAVISLAQTGDPARYIPVPPETAAKRKEAREIDAQALLLIKQGKLVEALPLLQSAATKEDEAFGHSSSSKYHLAKLLVRLNRPSEALDAYRRAFKWDSVRGDLNGMGPDLVYVSMDYAMLLAKHGNKEAAKAMYYFGLRYLNSRDSQSRFIEPVPFLIVFDEEEEGVAWDYSVNNIEAAATMAKVARGAVQDNLKQEMLDRVLELRPDWFYPLLWKPRGAWTGESLPQTLALLKSKAKPGLEKQLVQKFEDELAEHRAIILANETPLAVDTRPMVAGIERRSRMNCLKPNPAILREITVGW